ncbi:ATP-grasp domain-containing protein [Candidatus Dojkabacteria bacterium]|uniref:ATP-grasp domain-containing protein n=1 Tax=Candidatus Dojkabacteria bacterium TaxID=2099670 RepID=A0A955L9D0_9BACT|nr:ATP-grasp domain-containing protein [Candidatus Dojkabacteria bacterium]
MKELLNTVNQKLKNKPLIYFCREAERAIGLEHLLENYHICCIEDSDMVNSLKARGISIFCLEQEGGKLDSNSTNNLVSHEKTVEWIQNVVGENGFYALTFIPTNTIDYKIKNLGGTLLGNDYNLYLKYENKIEQALALKQNNIKSPEVLIDEIQKIEFSELSSKFSNGFVVQNERSHTGSGTFINPSEQEFNKLKEELAGNRVKVSEFITGEALTLNVVIYNGSIYIGGLQYQITGIPELTPSSGSTVGNDFEYFYKNEIADDLLVDITNEISKTARMLMSENYRGLFGLDFIIKNNEAFLIEINARQSANVPFQTQLELLNSETEGEDGDPRLHQVPQLLLHIAEFLVIKESVEFKHMPNLKGSQLFLRMFEDGIVENINKSGVYRLQSDESAINWETREEKNNVIYLDEDKDMPVIFQKDGYRIDDAGNEGFVLHFQKNGTSKNKFDEKARLQINNSIVDDSGHIVPWAVELMQVLK